MNPAMLRTMTAAEMLIQSRRRPRKSIFRSAEIKWSIEIRFTIPAWNAHPNSVRVTIIAENTEAMMPTVSVTANPLIGPVAFQKRIAAVMSVVAFASKMTLKALS